MKIINQKHFFKMHEKYYRKLSLFFERAMNLIIKLNYLRPKSCYLITRVIT